MKWIIDESQWPRHILMDDDGIPVAYVRKSRTGGWLGRKIYSKDSNRGFRQEWEDKVVKRVSHRYNFKTEEQAKAFILLMD